MNVTGTFMRRNGTTYARNTDFPGDRDDPRDRAAATAFLIDGAPTGDRLVNVEHTNTAPTPVFNHPTNRRPNVQTQTNTQTAPVHPTGKTYPCGTIQQMAAIPTGRRAAFLRELPDMVTFTHMLTEIFQQATGRSFDDVARAVQAQASWVDDGNDTGPFTLKLLCEGEEATQTIPRGMLHMLVDIRAMESGQGAEPTMESYAINGMADLAAMAPQVFDRFMKEATTVLDVVAASEEHMAGKVAAFRASMIETTGMTGEEFDDAVETTTLYEWPDKGGRLGGADLGYYLADAEDDAAAPDKLGSERLDMRAGDTGANRAA